MKGEPKPGVTDSGDLFSRRVALVLSIVIPLALGVTLIYVLIAPVGSQGRSHGSNTFSVSAVGFRALAEFLEATGTPVLASQHSSGQRASAERPLVVLAPPGDPGSNRELVEIVEQAGRRDAVVVVVLPKWWSLQQWDRPEWVADTAMLHPRVPGSVLAAVVGCDDGPLPIVQRRAMVGTEWSSALTVDATPVLPRPQLLPDELNGAEPLVWCDHGVLVARMQSTNQLLLISDPDLVNTAGLGRGDNAVLAHHLLVELLGAEALVFDETQHGFTRSPSIWREMLRFPLNLISVQLVLIMVVVLWSASSRFGAPLPPPPRSPAGVETLIDSTARLIGLAEHHDTTLDRYWQLIVRRTADEVGLVGAAAGSGTAWQRARRLADLGRSRHIEPDFDRLSEAVKRSGSRTGEARRHLSLARSLYRWRKEMTHGSHRNR